MNLVYVVQNTSVNMATGKIVPIYLVSTFENLFLLQEQELLMKMISTCIKVRLKIHIYYDC